MKKLVGSRDFYRHVFAIMTPVLIQNVITNFVNLLDNVMVGQIGTEQMSGVAIVNQLMFVFNLCIFGGLAGAGIFTAQFFGKGDNEGVKHTFRFKLYVAAASVAVFTAVFLAKGEYLISLFLHEGSDNLDLAATLVYAKQYLALILIQCVPFALMQVYASTLRETGETVLPMKAGISAVVVNALLNYVFIFGKLGLPAMGVKGAALATIIARFVECGIVLGWTHTHKSKMPFIVGAYSSLRVPAALTKQMCIKGAPLLVNEILWSAGMTMLNQCYSTRGLEVVSATNISSTISNLFFCAFFAMGSTISIIVGQQLGAGDTEKAVDTDAKLIALGVAMCVVVGAVMAVLAPFIPRIYNTTPLVKELACDLLLVSAAMMPVNSFTNSAYFTMRSGGRTIITFIFDSAFVWTICIPTAFVLSRYTDVHIVPMFIIVSCLDLIKCVMGFVLIKKRTWVNNLVA